MAKIRLNCPACGKKLSVGSRWAGQRGKCPRCEEELQIPDLPAEPAPEPGPAPAPEPADQVVSLAMPDELELAVPRAEERRPAYVEPVWTEPEDHEPPRVEPSVAREEEPVPLIPVASPRATGAFPAPTGAFPAPTGASPASAGAARAAGEVDAELPPAPEYGVLRAVAVCFKVLGVLIVAGGVVAGVLVILYSLASDDEGAGGGLLIGLLAAGSGLWTGAVTFAFGELLSLLPDIREDTYQTKHLLHRLLRRERGDPEAPV